MTYGELAIAACGFGLILYMIASLFGVVPALDFTPIVKP